MKEIKDIEIAGAKVSCKDGMYSLTDLWRAFTNSDMSKRPVEWMRLDETREYIQVLEKELKQVSSPPFSSNRATYADVHGGAAPNPPLYAAGRGHTANSYAHWMLFLAYAQYLSPSLRVEVNKTFTRVLQLDPTLVDEIYDKSSKAAKKHMEMRMAGKVKRQELTDTLQEHGVEGMGYAICTNAIYEGLHGKTALELKQERGLKKKDSLRDDFSPLELRAVLLSEELAALKIEVKDVKGLRPCQSECLKAGEHIGEFLK